MIALLGNLARDLRPGRAPRAGGGALHGARALRRLGVPALVFARCAEEDRAALFDSISRGVDARYLPGASTACFEYTYDGDRREMRVVAAGDVWHPGDVPALPAAVDWVHVSPLLRSDFPAETLAVIAAGRSVLFDGQGLVRPESIGPLVLDADFDPALLGHVTALKLAEEEAELLGDPAALPVAEVLVTHGSRGTTVYAGGRVEHVPAEPVDADPTGSGDAFGSAYASARATGQPPVEAAQRAATLVAELLTGG